MLLRGERAYNEGEAGDICLYIPKLRKGGCVPFFVTERKRSKLAPAALGTTGLALVGMLTLFGPVWLSMSLAVRFYKKREF